MKGLFSRCAVALALLVIVSGLLNERIEAKPAKQHDIVDTVSANPILTKFAAMIQASDMATFLSSRGPFTLFVPTDAAFDRLPPEQIDALLQPQNKERLQHILLFHLVNGKRLYAKDLLTMHALLSCEGTPLSIRTSRSGTQMVLKAKIVHADIRCLNGVIHEIDTLLMPPEASLPPLLPPPATNAPPANANAPSSDTNAPPVGTNTPSPVTPDPAPAAETNAAPMIPAAAIPETPTH
ncbi:MAG: fasciclin domain-containing protein [Methylacidiphilales bacterium]|nr:fasciclin domain-containing protein [Candidatus Methylacidiphilales bacterium]